LSGSGVERNSDILIDDNSESGGISFKDFEVDGAGCGSSGGEIDNLRIFFSSSRKSMDFISLPSFNVGIIVGNFDRERKPARTSIVNMVDFHVILFASFHLNVGGFSCGDIV
jgi:hypothetical protein